MVLNLSSRSSSPSICWEDPHLLMFADPEDGGGGKSLCVGDLKRGSEWPNMCLLQTHKREERNKPPPSSLPHTHTHTHTHQNGTHQQQQTNHSGARRHTAFWAITAPVTAPLLFGSQQLQQCTWQQQRRRWRRNGVLVLWWSPSIVGKQKNYRIGLSKSASHCVHRGRRSSQDWKDSTHMTTDCRVPSVWVLLHIQTRNKKQETRTRSLKEAAACMKKSFVGPFFLSSKCFLEWWDCNVITLQVFLDFNFNRRIFHNTKECHGFPPPSKYLLHS